MFSRSNPYADGQVLKVAGHPVRLKVSRRARRISLRVDRTNREILAVAPNTRRLAEAVDFARERRAWVSGQLCDLPEPESLFPDGEVWVFGKRCRLRTGAGRAQFIAGRPNRIVNCGRDEVDPWMAGRVIRREAAAVFEAQVAAYCRRLRVPRPKVATADATTRWGSCTPATRYKPASIRLSWRLALAPWDVADYVIAHECAHLVHPNHGAKFWALVERLVGDPEPHRAWLRDYGPCLHAFGRL